MEEYEIQLSCCQNLTQLHTEAGMHRLALFIQPVRPEDLTFFLLTFKKNYSIAMLHNFVGQNYYLASACYASTIHAWVRLALNLKFEGSRSILLRRVNLTRLRDSCQRSICYSILLLIISHSDHKYITKKYNVIFYSISMYVYCVNQWYYRYFII